MAVPVRLQCKKRSVYADEVKKYINIPYGDWFGMAECPRITVDWTVEPMILEEEGYVH